jgi:hypothetical protein
MSPINVIRRRFYNTIIVDQKLRDLRWDIYTLNNSYERKELKPIIKKYGGLKKSLHFNWNPLALNDYRWKRYNEDVINSVKATIEEEKVKRVTEMENDLFNQLTDDAIKEQYKLLSPLSSNKNLLSNIRPEPVGDLVIVGGRTRRQKKARAVTRRRR